MQADLGNLSLLQRQCCRGALKNAISIDPAGHIRRAFWRAVTLLILPYLVTFFSRASLHKVSS